MNSQMIICPFIFYNSFLKMKNFCSISWFDEISVIICRQRSSFYGCDCACSDCFGYIIGFLLLCVLLSVAACFFSVLRSCCFWDCRERAPAPVVVLRDQRQHNGYSGCP